MILVLGLGISSNMSAKSWEVFEGFFSGEVVGLRKLEADGVGKGVLVSMLMDFLTGTGGDLADVAEAGGVSGGRGPCELWTT